MFFYNVKILSPVSGLYTESNTSKSSVALIPHSNSDSTNGLSLGAELLDYSTNDRQVNPV